MTAPPSSPLTLAVHRGRRQIVTSEVASVTLARVLAATLAARGGFCTVRDRRGMLVYAVNSAGDEIDPAEGGSAAELTAWSH